MYVCWDLLKCSSLSQLLAGCPWPVCEDDAYWVMWPEESHCYICDISTDDSNDSHTCQYTYIPLGIPRSFFRPLTHSCAISAYSMASIRTSQVAGWVPWPPHHLVSPSCTASSSFRGWALKHAAIVPASSPTPSKSVFALPAVFLLTCILKSMA